MRKFISVVLVSVLLTFSLAGAGCGHKKVATDPQADAQAKLQALQKTLARFQSEAERLTVYADIGVEAIDQVKDSDLYKDVKAEFPDVEKAADIARTTLVEFSATAKPFVALSKAVTTLDPANKEQLKAAFEPTRKAVAGLRQPVQDLVKIIVSYLNKKGLTNVDLEQLERRIDFGFTVIDGAARLIPTWLQ